MIASRRWWVSFFIPEKRLGEMEIHAPWWISGERDTDKGTEVSVCVAVLADDEDHVKDCIIGCFDNPMDPEWRFIEERENNWSPFSGRFPRGDWMQWPTDPALESWGKHVAERRKELLGE